MIFRKRDWYCITGNNKKFKTLEEAEAFEKGIFDVEIPSDEPAEPVIVEFEFEVD